MRPLLVLILVVAALGAFYLAFSSGDDPGTADPGLAPDSVAVADPVDTPQRELDPLVDEGPRELVPDAGGDEAPRQAAASDDFRNRLKGRVVDEKRTPVAEAKVVLTRIARSTFYFVDDESVDRSNDRSTKTDEDGNFHFDDVEAFDGYALIATHADYGSTEVGQVLVGETGEYEEPPIILRPGVRVYGVITDTGGNAVHEADIRLSQPGLGTEIPDGPDTIRVRSNETGQYEIANVSPGQYSLNVQADGYGRVIVQKVEVEANEDLEMNVEVEVAQMIGGRVTSQIGEPIPNALVRAFSMPGRGQMSRSQTRTDDKGEFRFEDIPEGSYTILASETNYKPHRLQRIETGSMTLQISLIALPTVTGRVIDPTTGNPVQKFTVRLREPGGEGFEVPMPVPNTKAQIKNKNGEFTLHPPKAGTYVVEAVSTEFAGCYSDPFSIGEGQTLTDIVVNVTHGGTVRGRVVDANGVGIGGVTVSTHDNEWTDDQFMRALGDMYPTHATTRSVRTKSNGEFVIPNLTPATYLLNFKHENYTTVALRDQIVVEAKEAEVGDVTMKKGAELHGTVYGPSGDPLPGAVIHLTMQPLVNQFPASYQTKTGADGMYHFRHVQEGTYQIKAMRSGGGAGSDPFEQLSDMKESQRKIQISDGQIHKGEDFRLQGR